jgi:hypothetical protein
METVHFELNNGHLNALKDLLHKKDNHNTGRLGVEIVKMYFLSMDPHSKFSGGGRNEPDLIVESKGKKQEFEIKGTRSKDISFSKIKVSSKFCYTKLKGGMVLLRLTNLGEQKVTLHFMTFLTDFVLRPEDRWSVHPANMKG